MIRSLVSKLQLSIATVAIIFSVGHSPQASADDSKVDNSNSIQKAPVFQCEDYSIDLRKSSDRPLFKKAGKVIQVNELSRTCQEKFSLDLRMTITQSGISDVPVEKLSLMFTALKQVNVERNKLLSSTQQAVDKLPNNNASDKLRENSKLSPVGLHDETAVKPELSHPVGDAKPSGSDH